MSDEMSDETEIADGDSGGAAGKMPPATFEFLIHTLFTQALMAFGRIPNPITNKAM